MKRTRGLGFKLTGAFIVFLAVTLILCGITTYLSQMSIYREQCKTNVTNVARYLRTLITADGDDFLQFTDYFKDHYMDVNIPVDASEYLSYQETYEELFAKYYPGQTLGDELSFEELNDEVKNAYLSYTYLYWCLTFEKAAQDFGLTYTYFLTLNDETHYVNYVIDAVRQSRREHNEFLNEYVAENPDDADGYLDLYQGDEEEFLYLNDEVHNPLEENELMWKTWETGETQDGFRVWHNQWGDTYGYYVPLFIDNVKVGLIAGEIDIADVNTEILKNTLKQLAIIAVVFALSLIVLMTYINRKYISKIIALEASVQDYASSKDSGVVKEIEKHISGHDELTSLSEEIISMIIEIENYIKSLMEVHAELDETREHADLMQELANRDALTGIRNKTAYDKEIKRLEWELDDGNTKFGFAMVDLNFLKRINDTYGHEQGNDAIKRCCRLVCEVFVHSPVFRIGGDEFVVILEHHDYDHIEELVAQFNREIDAFAKDETLEVWERISAAIGYALYDKVRDDSVSNVFKRADKAMYQRKTEMKAIRS
ncbi:MAG: GGDEF domain-containing protein [Lachnospiraceae bacterium]|nr:GGDEF domain-containing protein [Lachnospiraceae bacterium]